MEKILNTKKIRRINERAKKRMVFYVCLVAIPSLQFLLCYVYVNFNSFILAFQNYALVEDGLGLNVSFAGFGNFVKAFELFASGTVGVGTSLFWFAVKVPVGFTLALLFSFYVYKKFPLSGFFRTILFMPQILSGLVFSLLFKHITTDVWVLFAKNILHMQEVWGLLDGEKTRLITVLIYNLWVGFGVNVLMFSGGMSGIDPSLVESAQLDGASFLKEFIYISVPLIWPTLVTFLITAITGIFTDQMNLYSLFSFNSHLQTLGYYLYVQTQNSDILSSGSYLSYSVLSAFGLILTAIMLPITLGVRHLLLKYGPKED